MSRDEAPWTPHALHAADRTWAETNCYVDVWIELLHARGLCVEAMLGFTLAVDFEGDQWTFFKPRSADLERLYGLRVEELTVWRDLESHLVRHTEAGRVVLVEVDAFYLPDTEGRDHAVSHAKTTIGVDVIDSSQQTLGYFHNRIRGVLSGADYRGALRIDPAPAASDLDPYCEIVKFGDAPALDEKQQYEEALDLLQTHFDRRPRANPMTRYAEEIDADLEALVGGREDLFDRYAFASIRQAGAAFSLASAHLDWLGRGVAGSDEAEFASWREAAESFEMLSSLSSRLILLMARMAHSGRKRDLSAQLDEMARGWNRGMVAVGRAIGRTGTS